MAKTSPDTAPTDADEQAAHGKGRPTPTRAEQEAARKRPLVADTKEAKQRARAELAKIQAVVDARGGGFTAGAADWDLYAEQVRRAEYDLDADAIKPYFELDRVLEDGVFFAAGQLSSYYSGEVLAPIGGETLPG